MLNRSYYFIFIVRRMRGDIVLSSTYYHSMYL